MALRLHIAAKREKLRRGEISRGSKQEKKNSMIAKRKKKTQSPAEEGVPSLEREPSCCRQSRKKTRLPLSLVWKKTVRGGTDDYGN